MTRYYFDYRDNDRFTAGDNGTEFSSIEEAKAEASRALTELAKDVLPGSVVRILAIEVRNDAGPVLRVACGLKSSSCRRSHKAAVVGGLFIAAADCDGRYCTPRVAARSKSGRTLARA